MYYGWLTILQNDFLGNQIPAVEFPPTVDTYQGYIRARHAHRYRHGGWPLAADGWADPYRHRK